MILINELEPRVVDVLHHTGAQADQPLLVGAVVD